MRVLMKFGGTSVGDGDKIKHVAKLVKSYADKGYEICVVASAMGDVTDELLDSAEKAKSGEQQFAVDFVKTLRDRHGKAAEHAIEGGEMRQQVLEELDGKLLSLERVLVGIAYLRELTPRSLDYVLSFGERLSSILVCGALRDLKLKARHLTGGEAGLITDATFGEARPLMDITSQRVENRLSKLMKQGEIPVVTGYIAETQEGVTTTLGRGGSDYTATILGVALKVDEIWIWTDVDGLMTADPKIEASARTLKTISYVEAMELAHFGAKAMHPRTLEPAMEANIPVRMRNTFNPDNVGTVITREERIKSGDIVKAIATIKNAALVTVGGAGMIRAPGMAAKVLSILSEKNVNVSMMSQGSSEANLSLIVPRSVLGSVVDALKSGLMGTNLAKGVVGEADAYVVAAVGAGMKGTPGVAAKVFSTVAKEGINIRMIAQGSSELNISFVVKESDGDRAVQALHREFKLQSV